LAQLSDKAMLPKLELRDVDKRYGDVRAVRGLSISLMKGEFVSLLGPSGCGKSTTLAMIAGFEQPTAGTIYLDGASIDHLPVQQRKIGLVFQDYAVFTKLSVRSNLSFGLEAKGVTRVRRAELVNTMAERLALSDVLERPGDHLNMSEMQRVALGRVLLTEPALVLLDEPMSNLDAILRASLRFELKQIQKQLGQTVLYVTHDQIEAMSMSDRIAVMNAGELQQFGSPDEIFNKPRNRFVAEFIGDPPINLLPCDVRMSGGCIAVGTAGHPELALGRGRLSPGRHLLAIRPHNILADKSAKPGSAPAIVRFIENFGSENVLHAEYCGDLIRIVVAANFAVEGEIVHVSPDRNHVHLIDSISNEVVAFDVMGAAT
jgi:multiple sugar transport system ATP-binding protein